MSYPNGVQATLLVNSHGPYGTADAVLKKAFDGAWVVGAVLN
jgi:hypothetical protein